MPFVECSDCDGSGVRIVAPDDPKGPAVVAAGSTEQESDMWFEDHSTDKLGVSYGGPVFSNQDLAECFGRKTIDGMIGNASLGFIEYYARLAASYARMAIEEREQQRCSRVHPESQALNEVRS